MRNNNGLFLAFRHVCLLAVILLGLATIIGSGSGDGGGGGTSGTPILSQENNTIQAGETVRVTFMTERSGLHRIAVTDAGSDLSWILMKNNSLIHERDEHYSSKDEIADVYLEASTTYVLHIEEWDEVDSYFDLTITHISTGGGNGKGSNDDCEIVMNAHGPGFLKVINSTNTHIMVMLTEYALGAVVRPGACELYGMDPGYRNVEIGICTDEECDDWTSTKKPAVLIKDDSTFEIVLNQAFFQ